MVDLLRQAGVDSFLTRAVIGHESEAMQRRYSKVRPEEARAAGERALRLIPGGVHSGVHRPQGRGGHRGGWIDENGLISRRFVGGRYWDRTSGFDRVKVALYR